MNNVNQFLTDANRRLSSFQNKVDDSTFDATSKFNDIWNDAQSELQEKYSLPAFHLWESGYCQGDASDDEVFEAAASINKVEDVEYNEEDSAIGVGPTVYAEWSEDDENIITDIYEYLDGKLLEMIEPKTEALIAEYEAWCETQIDD